MRRWLMLLFALAAPPAAAQDAGAGPFGIAMGAPIASLQVLERAKDSDPGEYRVLPPLRHPRYPNVWVLAQRSVGVCAIFAMTAPISVKNDFRAAPLIHAFDEALRELDARYGKPTNDARVAEPDHMFMRIIKGRPEFYQVSWEASAAKRRFPDVVGVGLSVIADSDEQGRVVLSYFFENHERCDQEAKADQDRAL